MKFEEMKDEDVEYKESEQIRFEEPGKVFVGKYIGFFEFEGAYGPGMGYKFIDVDDDELEYVIFADSVIKTKMERVPLDATLKIEYLGKKKSAKTGRMYKDYKFFLAKE